MAQEIERKFLVDIEQLITLPNGKTIIQGYIPTSTLTAVRVRIKDSKAYLTIKSANKGMTRQEFEYEIPMTDARQMLNDFCEKNVIEKTRYEILFADHLWELDIFDGDNLGLVVAEIELNDEDEKFEKPPWLLEEVTDDRRYYNSSLIDNPFSRWKK